MVQYPKMRLETKHGGKMSKLFKIFAAVCLAGIIFSLCGCAEAGTTRNDGERLNTILDQLADESKDGLGAGGAVRYAAKFIAWGKNSSMSVEEITATVVDWLKERTPEMQSTIRKWVGDIAEAGQEILSREEDVKDELQNSDWQEKVKTILQAVLESGGVDES